MVPSRSLNVPGGPANGGSHGSDPTRVATEFFEALAQQDWDDAAALVDPGSLPDFRESQLAVFVDWSEQRDAMRRAREEEAMYGWSSDGVLRMELLDRHGDVTLHAFPGAPTLRELAALPADAFAARYLAAAHRDGNAYRVLGHVLESDDVAHVLYRPLSDGAREDSLHVRVAHLRRRDGRWGLVMTQDIGDGVFILFHLDDPDESDDGTQASGETRVP